jgi:hypothetical protein
MLDPLVDVCSTLRSLHISSAGAYIAYWKNPQDDIMYASWARFIGSVRPTLELLSFEQGVDINDAHAPTGSRPGRREYHRLIDRLFVKHILPVLIDKPWPKMLSMQIRGVGRHTCVRSRKDPPTEEELSTPDTTFSVEKRENNVYTGESEYEITKTLFAFPQAAKEKLRGLLPDGAELILEEEQARNYELVQAEMLGIPDVYEEVGSG